jgi:hypothetical protein
MSLYSPFSTFAFASISSVIRSSIEIRGKSNGSISLAPFVTRLEDADVPGLIVAWTAQNHRPQIPQWNVAAESQGSSMGETA